MSFPNVPDSIKIYGGIKVDYIPSVDPTTDTSSDNINLLKEAVAEMTQTATQCFVNVRNDGYGPVVLAVKGFRGLWGSAPALQPSIVVNGTGDFNIVFPASFTDDLGISQAINLSTCVGGIQGAFGFISVTQLTPNSVNVKLATTAGAANAFTGKVISVIVW